MDPEVLLAAVVEAASACLAGCRGGARGGRGGGHAQRGGRGCPASCARPPWSASAACTRPLWGPACPERIGGQWWPEGMRIALGCDHAGFALKGPVIAALEVDGHAILDLGTFSEDPVDYPDFSRAVGQAVLRGFGEGGVLLCGSGVGASIAANKLRGVRAA